MTGALAGVKVVEVGGMITAPYAAKMLGDMGAEVLKIESPVVGDRARSVGPFPDEVPDLERSALFLYLNTNKLGVTLDLCDPDGYRIFERLVADADVLIHNMSPSAMDRMGLTYERVSTLNPRVVMTSITPFGLQGPYRDYLAEDLTIWSSGGGAYTNGSGDGDANVPPLRPFGYPASYAGGAHAATATLGAFIGAEASGIGEHVEVVLQAAMTAMTGNIMAFPYTGEVQTRLAFNLTQPLEAMEARGGWIWLQALEEHQWTKFVELMGNPDWSGRPEFKTKVLRTANWNELRPLVWAWVSQQDALELAARAQASRVPFAPLLTMRTLLESGHLRERRFFEILDHAQAGELRYPGALAKFAASPWSARTSAPRLGQHNEQVYRGKLGLSEAELTELRDRRVL